MPLSRRDGGLFIFIAPLFFARPKRTAFCNIISVSFVYSLVDIFDLHNDALTARGEAVRGDTVYAVWTTELATNEATALIKANSDKMLAIEDCEHLPLDYDFPENVMYCGLTWNGFNGLAGGAYSDRRLTERGKALIKRLNDKRIVVDTAHLNRISFYEVAERANKIICSHTCCYMVKNHPRNLTKEQISVIIQKGGIIGLCFVADFLGGNRIDDVIRHIDWFLSAFGDRHLGIGTDFFGTNNLPENLKTYDDFYNLVNAMVKRGYSGAVIGRILYENAATFFYNK